LRDFINYLTAFISSAKVHSYGELVKYAVFFLALVSARYFLNIVGEYSLRYTSISTMRGLAIEFINKIMIARPTLVLEKGDVIGRFMSDLERVSDLGAFIPSLLIQFARLLIGGFLLYVLNIYLFIVSVLAMPIYYLVFRVSTNRLARVSELERKEFASLSVILKNVVDSLLYVRLYPIIRRMFKLSSEKSIKSWSNRLRSVAFYDVFFNQSFHSIYDFVRIAILVIGGFLVARGLASIGSVIAFSTAVYNIYEPIANVSYMFASLGEFKPYVMRVREVLEAEAEEEDRGEELDKVEYIEAKGITVEVNGLRIISNISASFRRERIYAIQGPSGVGKSTFLLTLVRYYEPAEGSVIINDKDYRRYKLSSLRRKIVYVPQFPLVFKASLRENISLGENIPLEKMKRVIEVAKIDFINSLDEVIDPERLSDGQKQRIALARALAMDPDVLLLDEALNAVDEETEAHILRQLREEVRSGRLGMVVIVTHRNSTLRNVDYLCIMDRNSLKCSTTSKPTRIPNT